MKKQSFTFKLLVIGDSGVGKTSILMRYCQDNFHNDLLSTVGVDFKIKKFDLDDKEICLNIWDTAGQQRFKNITKSFYKNAHGIILTYAINNNASFNHIENWIQQIRENGSQGVILSLVGSKLDLQSYREVTRNQGKQLADKFNIKFTQISAKENINIDEVFEDLTRELIKKHPCKDTVEKKIIAESLKQKQKKKKECC